MFREQNMAVLSAKFSQLHTNISNAESQLMKEDILVEDSKSGPKTLSIFKGDRKQYMHSMYDPIDEAVQLVKRFELNIDQYDQLFFYGIGLGYHVEVLAQKYPDKEIIIYEPNPYIFYQYILHGGLHRIPIHNIKAVYTDFVKQMANLHYLDITNSIQNNVLLITTPSYQRIYKEETEQFEIQLSEMIIGKRNGLNTNFAYQRIWLINSLHNFYKVLETPNILREKKQHFENVPVILVSAGPSLSEEFENLRYIKENKLAYIFAVGSANRALINAGIRPDAVTSYDPNYNNYTVFQEIIDQKLEDIPLVFGSSGNYKTVQLYPGPQLHMFINQDTLSPYFLGSQLAENGELLQDAPSIAVVTLELLFRLGANPIILAGQNFAFRNEEYFAKGIHYDFRPANVTEQEKHEMVYVESVDGELIGTSRSHMTAKRQMDSYLTAMSQVRTIWNTTKGGAKLEGANFRELASIMETELLTPVVNSSWYEGRRTEYDWVYIKKQSEILYDEHDKLAITIDDLVKILLKISALVDHRQLNKLERLFFKFDDKITEMLNNKYYRVFLRPMTRTMFEATEKTATEIRLTSNVLEKAQLLLNRFGSFMEQTKELYTSLMPFYFSLDRIIKLSLDKELENQEEKHPISQKD